VNGHFDMPAIEDDASLQARTSLPAVHLPPHASRTLCVRARRAWRGGLAHRSGTGTGPHSASRGQVALLRKFLGDLPEPVLTYALFQEFIDIARVRDQQRRINDVKVVISSLPAPNQMLLFALAEFLHLATEWSMGELDENALKARTRSVAAVHCTQSRRGGPELLCWGCCSTLRRSSSGRRWNRRPSALSPPRTTPRGFHSRS
jgi:hypothetical protein